MIGDWELYRRLIGVQVRSQLQYKFSFVMDFFSTAALMIVNFGTLALILQRFHTIAGWTLGELAFLYGMVEASFGVMDMVFSGLDYDRFGEQIRLGRLDQLLLRPASITVQVLGSEFYLRRLGKIGQGILVFWLALYWTHFHWTLFKLLYLPVVFFSLFCFFGGLYLIGSTVTFWTVQGLEAMNILTYGGGEMISYPMSIYPLELRRFFTYVLPAIFLNYYPALYFLDKPDPLHMPAYAPFLAPVVGVGTLLVAFRFWGFGIRHYQSTGT
jgi:ABC-2 type transport system permease protein